MEGKLDRLIFFGATGVFNGIASDASSTNDTNSDDWETGTESGDITAVRKTFDNVIEGAVEDTNGLFTEFDFVLSLKQWLKLRIWVPATTAGQGSTLGEFLLSKVPGVRSITLANRLGGVGADGKDRLLAFPRDPRVLDALVPIRFSQTAPQLNGMVFTTYCEGKYGGIRIRHPKAVRRADVTMS